MCHHYRGARNPPEHLRDEFSIRSNLALLTQLWLPVEGFYPLSKSPIVRVGDAGEREVAAAQWGFLPRWWKPSAATPKRTSFQRRCFNARSEDVHQKPTYRDAFRSRRCLMPADEFFEKGHYFGMADGRAFACAALWDQWRGADGEIVETCTMLTTEPNEIVRSVGHNRMPVLLTSEADYARWLDSEIVERGPLEGLFAPLDSQRLRRAKAPPAIR